MQMMMSQPRARLALPVSTSCLMHATKAPRSLNLANHLPFCVAQGHHRGMFTFNWNPMSRWKRYDDTMTPCIAAVCIFERKCLLDMAAAHRMREWARLLSKSSSRRLVMKMQLHKRLQMPEPLVCCPQLSVSYTLELIGSLDQQLCLVGQGAPDAAVCVILQVPTLQRRCSVISPIIIDSAHTLLCHHRRDSLLSRCRLL